MTIPVGTTLGRYEIRSKLGAGGMGEVYLAQDTQLGRRVAIKLLLAETISDEHAKKRLRKEARAAATLDHPNICSVYEVGEEGGRSFIAMQYVEGETLDARIKSKPPDLKESLAIASQIADALAEAHAHGIIHRDIKPGNIMVTPRGQVKVMDFGLARMTTGAIESEAETQSLLTTPGSVIGTVPYMSPEQVRGEHIDARSDIFSFGVVLYEMLSGQQPFASESAAATASAILTHEPAPLARFTREAPAELERIVVKALTKDREERYQTAKDLLIDLRRLKQRLEVEAEIERSAPPEMASGAAVPSPAGTAPRAADTARAPVASAVATEAQPVSSAKYIVSEIKRHKRGLAVALTLGSLVVSAAIWYLLPRLSSRTKEASTPLRNAAFIQLTDQPGPEFFPSLSPDGKSFVYASYLTGNWDIYLQRVGGKNPVNLTKDSLADDIQPAFSPDGERIAFRSEREGGGIFVMGATGESVKRLTDFGYNSAWSPDGKEIACADEGIADPYALRNPGSRIWAVSVATGEKRLVTKENSMQPNWSPHGTRIAYWGRRSATIQRDVWTIPASGGEPIEVTNDAAMDWNPVWSPDGKYLYFASDRGGSMNLWRVLIEESAGKVLAPPEAVTTPSSYSGHLSFSQDGRRMAYAQLMSRANLQQASFDPNKETVTGQPVWTTQGSRRANTPDLSPDGEWLAFDSQGGTQDDLFVIRRDGTSLRQLTDDIYRDRQPRWSPDGKRIAFFTDRSGKTEVWTINADGSGLQQITYTSGVTNAHAWSPDGARLVYRNADVGSFVIEVGKPWTEQTPQVLPTMSDSSDWFPWSWSPDGRKLAGYTVRAGAPDAVVVYSFESRQYEKLTDFGRNPIWLRDSRRLVFQNQGKLYLVDSESKKVHEVLSVAPQDFGHGVTLSRDDRLIYFSLLTTEADVWLMTLE